MTLSANSWALSVEGAGSWVAEGVDNGLHGYDTSTWTSGAALRMESWNASGDFGAASIDGVAIKVNP
jgi:hypothetical protein